MDPALLAALDTAVLVLRHHGHGAVLVEHLNPAARVLLRGSIREPGTVLPHGLDSAWQDALAEAGSAGSAALPPVQLAPDARIAGTARRLGDDQMVLTITRVPDEAAAEAVEILDELSEMVCRWRPDGTIYYCNTAYARQCGLLKEQVVGARLHDLTPAGELPQILANVARLGRERPAASYDHHVRQAGGEERWQEWIDQALFDAEGCIVGYQSTGRDITRRKLAETGLQRSEQRLRLALGAGRQRVWELELSTGKVRVFPLGGDRRGVLWRTWADLLARVHEEDRPRVTTEFERLQAGQTDRIVVEYRLARTTGSFRWVASHAVALERDEAGRAELIVGTSVDVDIPREVAARLRDSEERLRLALEAAGLAVWEVDLGRALVRLDRAGMARLGLEQVPFELPLRMALRMINPADRKELLARLRSHLAGRSDHLRAEQRMQEASGAERWVELHGLVTTRTMAGKPQRMIGVAAEITARKAAELRLETLALEDHLTRLPNRRALDGTLERAIAQGDRERGRLGVLLLDLDGFKAINDRLGHLAGDELLVEAARRLRRFVRRSDMVARFGGDEFAVVAPGVRTRRQLEQLAKRLIAGMEAPVTLTAGPVRIRVSIGIAVFPDDGHHAVALLAQADAALYAAKREGGGYRFAAARAAA